MTGRQHEERRGRERNSTADDETREALEHAAGTHRHQFGTTCSQGPTRSSPMGIIELTVVWRMDMSLWITLTPTIWRRKSISMGRSSPQVPIFRPESVSRMLARGRTLATWDGERIPL